MPQTHLMTVDPRSASQILTGEKIVEARLEVDRRAPFGTVSPGDILYIKPTGQRVIGRAIVQRVDQYEGLSASDVEYLRGLYADRVRGGAGCWDAKTDAGYATFITLAKVSILRDDSTVPAELLGPGEGAWRVLQTYSGPAKKAA